MTNQKKILFICGSLNQTRQMHAIARELGETDNRFTPYYVTGPLAFARRFGLLEMTIGGAKLAARCLDYLAEHGLTVDENGRSGGYDLTVTCTDQVVPDNVRGAPIVLVQEGMLDPTNLIFHLHKFAPRLVPRWLAGTAATGQSKLYQRFCVASEGYRDYFVRHGIPPDTIRVTGIPNFDDCKRYLENDFPHRGHVLVVTSDARETFKYDDRKKFIARAVKIARGRQLIFKLHPNENFARAIDEIERYAPGALVFTRGSAEEMAASAAVVICQYSTLAFVALALGKEVHTYFNLDVLRALAPVQNGRAALNIADEIRALLWLPRPQTKRRDDAVRTEARAR